MKIIELYNLITNKEYDKLPNKIMLKDYDYIFTLREDCTGYKWYGEVNNHEDFGETIHQNLEFVLNLEIISLDKIEENKIPEKLDLILDEQFTNDELQAYIYETQEKVNQVIDYLKSKGDE